MKYQWLMHYKSVFSPQTNRDFLFAHVNLSIFLSPGGDKFVQLLCALASHIMEQRPKKKPSVAPPSGAAKTVLANQFRFQMIKGNLVLAIQNWAKLTSDFQSQYQQQKQLAQ
jgi:HAUS augmin-like complex subunit 6 N-terminus